MDRQIESSLTFMKLTRIPLYILLAVNTMVSAAMIICGYAQHINPAEHSSVSYWGMLFPFFLLPTVGFLVFWLVVRWRYAFVSVLALMAGAVPLRTFCPLNLTADPPEGCIKVLSYNIMYFNGVPKGTPVWENEILRYILDSQADIVCLQESSNLNFGEISDSLRAAYPYMCGSDEPNDMLFILSRFPLLNFVRIDYESTTNRTYYSEAVYQGDTIIIINNHLQSYQLSPEDKDSYKTMMRHPKDSLTESRYTDLVGKLCNANVLRSAQADSVGAFIDAHRDRTIICCGDFNDPSLSYTHHRLTRWLNDAFTRSGNGVGWSYNRSGMYFRIDNILVSPNITTFGTKVDAYSKVSDHYPIFSYLKIGG